MDAIVRQGLRTQRLDPQDHWLEDWEKQAIIKFHFEHPLNGYRRLTYMMLDANVVAVSAASVYRLLSEAGLMRRSNSELSKKGTGFVQPQTAHQHWHLDIAYLNTRGTLYFIAKDFKEFIRVCGMTHVRTSPC